MRFVDSKADVWAGVDDPDAAIAPHRLLTPEQWQAVRLSWPANLPVGLILSNSHDVRTLEGSLSCFAAVALQFPKWTDGRAYSQARLLRVRLRYTGDIRAIGDILVDMALPLARTGFDTAVLRADQDLEVAQHALRFFDGLLSFPGTDIRRGGSVYYQGDALDPDPLFRKAVA
ncbi:DUF934 domain-containing protein [Thiomonas sp. FB-Cd]|uniref:DUF934 domain-containing protein n=1 Tax=Thiomonas sp. FB-Cd TaxID=1158292 RepID=UPI0004DFCC1F|nr:DUF934 domain-containing protein [Thiomonas sp. FB-Cd]